MILNIVLYFPLKIAGIHDYSEMSHFSCSSSNLPQNLLFLDVQKREEEKKRREKQTTPTSGNRKLGHRLP